MKYVTLFAKDLQEILARNVWFTPDAELYLLELINQSDNENVKKWIKRNLRNYLTNDVKLDKITRNTKLPDNIPEWLKEKRGKEDIYILTINNLKKRTFPLNDIIKYLDSVLASNTNVANMSVPDVLEKYTEWKRTPKEGKKQVGVRLIEKLPNGYSWYLVTGRKALIDEGKTMQNCLKKDGYYNDVKAGRIQIFSLRDTKGESHVTIEYRKNENKIKQIKGKQNEHPNQKYHQMILDFINQNNYEIGDNFDFASIRATQLVNGHYVLLYNYHGDLSGSRDNGPLTVNPEVVKRPVCDFPSIQGYYVSIRRLEITTKEIQCENLYISSCKSSGNIKALVDGDCEIAHSDIKELSLGDVRELTVESSNIKINAKTIDKLVLSSGMAGTRIEFGDGVKIERLNIEDTPVEHEIIFGSNTTIDEISDIPPTVNLMLGSNSRIGELQNTSCLSSLPDELQILGDLTIDGKKLPKLIGVNVRVNGNLLVVHSDIIPKDVMNKIKSIKYSKLILEK